MRVRPAHEGQRPALLPGDVEEVLHEGVVLVGHRAVLHLEDVEESQHRPDEVFRRLPHPVGLEEMVRGVEKTLGAEVVDEVEDIPALLRDDLVLGERQVEDVHVDPLAGLRKEGLDLLGDEEVREARAPVEEPETAVDRVVVRERHEVHPPGLREAVGLVGVVVRVAGVPGLEVLEDRGVGVEMEVGPRQGQLGGGQGGRMARGAGSRHGRRSLGLVRARVK